MFLLQTCNARHALRDILRHSLRRELLHHPDAEKYADLPQLKKAFIRTDCQNSQLKTRFRNFTNKSWGSRWEKQTVLMAPLLSVRSHWPPWPLSFNVRHPWGEDTQERDGGGHTWCSSWKYFLPNGHVYVAVFICCGFIALLILTTLKN